MEGKGLENVSGMDSDYFIARSRISRLEKERRTLLQNGDIIGYFSKSTEGGFEIEQELIDSYPQEYNEFIQKDYRQEYSKSEVKNDLRRDYLNCFSSTKDFHFNEILNHEVPNIKLLSQNIPSIKKTLNENGFNYS